jgi:quercetin dioxygenase-like cupin family protein
MACACRQGKARTSARGRKIRQDALSHYVDTALMDADRRSGQPTIFDVRAVAVAAATRRPKRGSSTGGAVFDIVIKRFDRPDDVRTFDKGRFELVHIGGLTLGRATYEPGWRWSEHVGRSIGQSSCRIEHIGIVIAGCATAAMDDGRVVEMRAGDLFHIPPGHDSWVVGDEQYISLHLIGATAYARAEPSRSPLLT